MTSSPAKIVAYLLADLGLTGPVGGGAEAEWPVYYSGEPDTPDRCVTVYDQDGPTFGRIQATGEVTGHGGFQVRVRATSHDEGWNKASEIVDGLSRTVYMRAVVVGDAPYTVQCVNGLASVLALGRDRPTSSRRLFTVNGTVVLAG